MTDFSAERSLLVFLLLNAAVFGSAFLFAVRQMTRSRSQALLDAALLGYSVQYTAVGLPGMLGCLHPMQVYLTAITLSAGLFLAGLRSPSRFLRYTPARLSRDQKKVRHGATEARRRDENGTTDAYRSTPIIRRKRTIGLTLLICVRLCASVVSNFLLSLSLRDKNSFRENRKSWDSKEEPDLSSVDPGSGSTSETGIIGIALFVISFVVLFAHARADQPVFSNDAMTYHFPAAVQWLQQGKIGLFQTWFFNPANTYSPLAGSIFVTWLIVPFGNDVLARFVEVPALFCVALATYRLCCQTGEPVRPRSGSSGAGTPRLCAGFIAAAAVLARPIFEPCMMGKDDLFVAFFFIAALVALSPEASKDRWGPSRFAFAVGLLLATKYTALMCAPLLLLAIDGPRWRARRWLGAIAIVFALAGPWYLRNWIDTGNPLFPMDVLHLFHGLFTTSHSSALGSIRDAVRVVVGGAYGLPIALAIILGFSWIACCILAPRVVWSNPILRACAIGPIVGIALFFWRSPFPEVRFLLPVFLMLFACVAVAIQLICRIDKAAVVVAALITAVAAVTVLDVRLWRMTAWLPVVSLVIAATGILVCRWAGHHRLRRILIGSTFLGIFCIYSYINWTAYCSGGGADAFYALEYPEHEPLWRAVDEKVPADATVAYTNIYLVYPMQGHALNRRLVYVPTRGGVASIADLGWLGDDLSGEQLVAAATRATIAAPSRSSWLENLRKSGAEYLVIGRGAVVGVPPEARFVAENHEFTLLFQGQAGWVYQIAWN